MTQFEYLFLFKIIQILSHLEVVLRQNQNLKSANSVLMAELKTLHGLTEESEEEGQVTRNQLQAIARRVINVTVCTALKVVCC